MAFGLTTGPNSDEFDGMVMRTWILVAAVSVSLLGCQKALPDQSGIGPTATDPHGPVASPHPSAPVKGRPKPGPTSPEAITRAQTLYAQRCALCHGHTGRGDGIAAENLRPAPRSLADAAWQRDTRDEAIALIIVKGGAAVGKSLMMPASEDLADDPETVQGLVAVVRAMAPKEG